MKNRNLTGLAALSLAASVAVLAPTHSIAAEDPLACFRDPDGHHLALGQDVVDRQGRLVGWVSVSQCVAGQPQGELLVRLGRDLGGGLATVPQGKVEVREGRAVVSHSLEELRRLAGTLTGSG